MRSLLLYLLLLSCFVTVFGGEDEPLTGGGAALQLSHRGGNFPPIEAPAPSHHHHQHHHHPPTPAPVHPRPPTHLPPTHPPLHPPPTHYPPAHPPLHPPPTHYPPTHPPVHAPSHPPPAHPPPVHPPIYAPARPPLPPRSLVAVQGVVFCKSCKYRGVDNLLGASPLLGATVKLQCNNTKYPLVVLGKTDKNGYFFIQAPKKITTYGAHKCRVSLVSSPSSKCNVPTNLHFGPTGAILRLEKPRAGHSPPSPYSIFSVGPFAFEPAKKLKCPR